MKSIFKIVLALLFLGIAVFSKAQNDAISKYFEQYVEDERFTVVYISPKMFDLITKLDLENMEDLQDEPEARAALQMVEDLDGLRVLTTDETPDKFFKEAQQKIPTSDYDLLMTVRDEGENVRIFTKDDGGNIIKELLLMVGGKDEFVMLSLIGEIDLKKVSKLAKVMDVKGAKHLEKVKDKD